MARLCFKAIPTVKKVSAQLWINLLPKNFVALTNLLNLYPEVNIINKFQQR